VIFSFWSVHYIALELEQPFGDDPSDIPMREMQIDFNTSLRELMKPYAFCAPELSFDPRKHSALRTQRASLDGYLSRLSSDLGDMHRVTGKRRRTRLQSLWRDPALGKDLVDVPAPRQNLEVPLTSLCVASQLSTGSAVSSVASLQLPLASLCEEEEEKFADEAQDRCAPRATAYQLPLPSLCGKTHSDKDARDRGTNGAGPQKVPPGAVCCPESSPEAGTSPQSPHQPPHQLPLASACRVTLLSPESPPDPGEVAGRPVAGKQVLTSGRQT